MLIRILSNLCRYGNRFDPFFLVSVIFDTKLDALTLLPQSVSKILRLRCADLNGDFSLSIFAWLLTGMLPFKPVVFLRSKPTLEWFCFLRRGSGSGNRGWLQCVRKAREEESRILHSLLRAVTFGGCCFWGLLLLGLHFRGWK